MSDKEYEIWENTWKHKVLEKLEKEYLTWKELQYATKLPTYSLNIALKELSDEKIITRKNQGTKKVYTICKKYEILSHDDENRELKKEINKEEELNELLTAKETKGQKKEVVKALYESELRSNYMKLIMEAKESIIIASPFIRENILIRDLEKKARNLKNFLLVTRPSENVWGEVQKKEQERWIKRFRDAKAKVIEDKSVHAKILIVDKKECLISSMNLTKDSISDNKEFGIYTDSEEIIKSAINFVREMGDEVD